MSKSKSNDSSQWFLSSANIKQAFSLEHPRKSLRLAEKKDTNEEPTAEPVVDEPSRYIGYKCLNWQQSVQSLRKTVS